MPQTAEQQTRLRDFTRRLRDERFGGNDSALARAMGVNQSTVHRFLSGKTIRLDVMEKIAKVAGVKLAVLLDGSPPPLPDNDQEPARGGLSSTCGHLNNFPQPARGGLRGARHGRSSGRTPARAAVPRQHPRTSRIRG